MISTPRLPIPASLTASPVVAVLRAATPSAYIPVIDALLAGGLRHVELTLSTPGTLEALPSIRARFGDAASIGIGTITAPHEADTAIERGADFIVTPTMQPAVIARAVAAGLPVFPGGFTPTELHAAWQAGATAVKVFPASALGPGYVKDLRGPFPDIQMMPSGGVSLDTATTWLDAGACAVSIGGPLLQDAFSGGDPAALTARTSRLMSLVTDAGYGAGATTVTGGTGQGA